MQGPLFQALGQAPFKTERAQMCVHVGEEGRGARGYSGTTRTLVMEPEWAMGGVGHQGLG